MSETNGLNAYRRRRKTEKGSIFDQLDGYDPEAYYTGAVDEKGHQITLRVAVPPEIKVMLDNIVASRQFPYLNVGQLVRDAIVHACQCLADQSMNYDLQREMQRILARENVNNIERDVRADMELVEKSRAAADIVIRGKDWPAVAGLASSLADCLDGLRDPYQSQIATVVADLRNALPETWKVEVDD